MFFYLPLFMFAGAMLYAFPGFAFWLTGVYLTALIWPRLLRRLRNGPRYG